MFKLQKVLKTILAFLLAGTMLTGCSKDSSPVTIESVNANALREQQVTLKGNGEDSVTVLVYMNGSTLESDYGMATEDLTEMVNAGSSDQVNVVVQTMGTKSWEKTYGIASNRSQIYEVDKNGLTLVKDDLGQLDCTDPDTLSDFIEWGATNYPADRYILLMWDHGGGPVYGFGYDEFQSESAALTLDEMQSALNSAGVYFDFIGFDACIMASMEVCCALYDYCDYMILSEDFESGIGWYYTDWLKTLYNDPSVDTKTLGTQIVDDMVDTNETDRNGSASILSLIDESMMKVLYTAWTEFAYANEDALLESNYSQEVESRGRYLNRIKQGQYGQYSDWQIDAEQDDEYSLDDYYITDIMALASTVDSTESDALESAVSQAIVYTKSTSDEQALTGISVTLPYGDSNFYNAMSTIFYNCGFDSDYITWLKKFVSATGSSDYYNYDEFNSEWSGWSGYTDQYDWSDFDTLSDDSYYSDDNTQWGWSSFSYSDSFNSWSEENDEVYYEDNEWYNQSDDSAYQGSNDWYYGNSSYDFMWGGH